MHDSYLCETSYVRLKDAESRKKLEYLVENNIYTDDNGLNLIENDEGSICISGYIGGYYDEDHHFFDDDSELLLNNKIKELLADDDIFIYFSGYTLTIITVEEIDILSLNKYIKEYLDKNPKYKATVEPKYVSWVEKDE